MFVQQQKNPSALEKVKESLKETENIISNLSIALPLCPKNIYFAGCINNVSADRHVIFEHQCHRHFDPIFINTFSTSIFSYKSCLWQKFVYLQFFKINIDSWIIGDTAQKKKPAKSLMWCFTEACVLLLTTFSIGHVQLLQHWINCL